MLCPEVSNFPAPKVYITHNKNQSLESVYKIINMNHFYKSIVVTCPDEMQTPSYIEEVLTEDADHYKIMNCSLTEFIEPIFIENFVKNGNLYCLSTGKNCIIQNCAAITPDGVLTLHIIDFIYQTLGFEGTKRPHNFYEIKIDLKNIKHFDKIKRCLSKLELFDFIVSWEPNQEDVCPSSIAKYFNDRNIGVALCTPQISRLSPTLKEIPSIKDTDIEDIVEWIGLLAHEADIYPTNDYLSTYCQPDSELAIKSNRISVLIIHGFISPKTINNVCNILSNYVSLRELNNYWAAISVQSYENSIWQWNLSSPRMFQAHDSSCNIFFSRDAHTVYTIGQVKYS